MSFLRALIVASTIAGGFIAAPAARADVLSLLHLKDSCESPWVLDYIRERYQRKFKSYAKTDLLIVDIRHPTLRHERERDEEHRVGRQYCHATVVMTDRKKRDLFYLLEYPWGYAGQLTHVEFCIPGFDRWHVYGKQCSTVR